MITTLLFDLDGTLLPMDMDEFTSSYFAVLARHMAPFGYEPRQLIRDVWAGTKAMVENDGSRTNEEAFWRFWESRYPDLAASAPEQFLAYYGGEFDRAREVCGRLDGISDFIERCKARGLRVALATNPLFPDVATRKRIGWAGLAPEQFELYTTFENSRYCKPNLDYYREVTARLGVAPEQCLMVGNDVDEDMVAENLGMRVFLLGRHLLNRHGADIGRWPHGDLAALEAYIDALLSEGA